MTDPQRRRASRSSCSTQPQPGDPTPQEIEEYCRALQATWTPEQRRRRCLATSRTLQRHLQALAAAILPPPPAITGINRLADLARFSSRRRT